MNYRYVHLSQGMVYNIMHTPAKWGLKVFFRSLHINGFKKVPVAKPVLLAVNHPTAFIDPLPICTFMEAPIYNMTRGDIFRKPFFRKLLESTNMFPVFRMRDGYTGRDRNAEVFEWCKTKLREGRIVTIYVEGEHHWEKHVRPVKKGLANIAFGAYEQYRIDELQIFPVGCAYRYGDRAREEGRFTVGEPLWVRDYWPMYQENANAAIQKMCNDIEEALKKVCYHLEDETDETLGTQTLALYASENPEPWFPSVQYNTTRFAAEKALLDRINTMDAAEKAALGSLYNVYFDQLTQQGLDDDALYNRDRHTSTGRLLFLALGFLPFVWGWVTQWPIRRLGYWVAKSKVKKKEFFSSVLFGVCTLSGTLYYTLWLILSLFSGHIGWVAAALSLPLFAWFAIIYRDIAERYFLAQKAKKHPQTANLMTMRAAVTGR
jgi:glycerol-3-phosphate O-acyltransferase / dihydroxyacetone phosphate acyltransferase